MSVAAAKRSVLGPNVTLLSSFAGKAVTGEAFWVLKQPPKQNFKTYNRESRKKAFASVFRFCKTETEKRLQPPDAYDGLQSIKVHKHAFAVLRAPAWLRGGIYSTPQTPSWMLGRELFAKGREGIRKGKRRKKKRQGK